MVTKLSWFTLSPTPNQDGIMEKSLLWYQRNTESLRVTTGQLYKLALSYLAILDALPSLEIEMIADTQH